MFTTFEVSKDFISLCPFLEENKVFHNEKHESYDIMLVVCAIVPISCF